MSDFSDAVADLEGGKPPIAAPAAKKKTPTKKKVPGPLNEKSIAAQMRKAKKVRIVLEENEGIPPGGQFIAINGYGYNIKPGEEVDVPEPLLDILDNARVSRPIRDSQLRVVGYRHASRLPYRIVRDTRKKAGKQADE